MTVATKIAEFRENDDVACVQFSPDGAQLAVTTATSIRVDLWTWKEPSRVQRTLKKPPGTADLLFSNDGCKYSPDGEVLAITHAISADEYGRSVVDIFDP